MRRLLNSHRLSLSGSVRHCVRTAPRGFPPKLLACSKALSQLPGSYFLGGRRVLDPVAEAQAEPLCAATPEKELGGIQHGPEGPRPLSSAPRSIQQGWRSLPMSLELLTGCGGRALCRACFPHQLSGNGIQRAQPWDGAAALEGAGFCWSPTAREHVLCPAAGLQSSPFWVPASRCLAEAALHGPCCLAFARSAAGWLESTGLGPTVSPQSPGAGFSPGPMLPPGNSGQAACAWRGELSLCTGG